MPHLRTTWSARAFVTERGQKILVALANPSIQTDEERKLVSELNTIVTNLAQRDVQPRVAKGVGTFAAVFSAAMKGKAQ